MQVGSTVGVGHTAAAPAGAASLATVTAPEDGVYSVRAYAILTGTAETQLTNLRLLVAGVNKINNLPSVPGFNTAIEIDRIQAKSGDNFVIAVGNAATAGSIYTTLLLLTRVA